MKGRVHTPEILFEDNHLIVLQKPFCMPSQGDISGDLSIFNWTKNYIKVKYNKPGEVYLALIHRLDRPVGGVMVMGKTSKAAKRLSSLFHDRKVQKTYYAICERSPQQSEGILVNYLVKMQDKNRVLAYKEEMENSQRSELEYQVLKRLGKRALLEIRPKTGRKHQIRVQLASIGCIIVGDVKYGLTDPLEDLSIRLFAKRLEFIHPVRREPVCFEAELPKAWGITGKF